MRYSHLEKKQVAEKMKAVIDLFNDSPTILLTDVGATRLTKIILGINVFHYFFYPSPQGLLLMILIPFWLPFWYPFG
jgi:hypothetical protein